MAQIAQFMSWDQVKQLAEAALKAEIEKKHGKALPLFQQTAKECLQFLTRKFFLNIVVKYDIIYRLWLILDGAKTDAEKDLARKLCQKMIGKANATRKALSSCGEIELTGEKTASRKR